MTRFDKATAPMEEPPPPVALAAAMAPGQVFRRFWPWVRRDRLWLFGATLMLVLGAAGQVMAILLFKNVIDKVLVPRDFSAFWPLAGLMLTVALVSALLKFAGEYTATWVAERFMLRLRTEVVAHLHTLPPDTLRRRWHGDTVARLTMDIANIEQMVASGVIEVGSALISLVFFGTAALLISWPLALAVFAVAPVFWLAARVFGGRVQSLSREARRRDGGVTAVVEESLANASLAHAYNQQDREVERVRAEGQALLRAEMSTARVAHLYPALLEVLEVGGGLVVVGLGAFELTQGALTIGGLLAFAAFMTELFSPVQQLSQLATTFGSAAAGAERVVELLETHSPVSERPGAQDHTALRGDASDGLPGVAGIGEKSAAALLAHFGDLDGILAAVADPESALTAAQRAKFVAAADYLAVAPRVVQVVPDLDLPRLEFRQPDREAAEKLAAQWGLSSSMERVLAAL